MTTTEVLYRYLQHPTEEGMRALGKLCEVYGIRNIHVDKDAKTVRVEYDATRLTGPTVYQLLRRTGLVVAEEIPLVQPSAPVEAAAPAAKA